MCFGRLFGKKYRIHPEETDQPKLNLNNTQKYLIKSFLTNDVFDAIHKLNPSNAAHALAALDPKKVVSLVEIKEFQKRQVWDCIELVRAILTHPTPQNRVVSILPERDGLVSYRDAKGKMQWEPKGLLGLTGYSDGDSLKPVTKDDVVKYVMGLIVEAKEELFKERERISSARGLLAL